MHKCQKGCKNMDRGCMCNDCYYTLINVLVQEEYEIDFDTTRPHLSGQVPYIELPYKHENGNEYTKGIEADANYCCQCGAKL